MSCIMIKRVKDMELYRYISFDKFKDVIENKVLMFVNPLIEWEKLDQNEAYLYKAIKDNKNLKKLKEGHIKKAIINQYNGLIN